MSIQYQLNFNDVLALQKDVIKHSETHKTKQLYFRWIIAAILFLAVLLSFGPSTISAAAGAIVTIIYLILFFKLYETITFKRIKSKMHQQDYSHILAPCRLELTANGIVRTINGAITHFDWDTFIRIGEDEDHYFLYQTELQGLILPKQPKNLSSDETKEYQSWIHTRAPKT